MKVLVFGEILWDIIEGTPHLGGAPLNYAAHIKQCGDEAMIISAVGNDEMGEKALELVGNMGVDASEVQQVNMPTGYVPVTLLNGQPEYEITRDVAYDYIKWEDLDQDKLKGFNSFYFGSIIQRSPESNRTLYQILDTVSFENVFYDVNLRKNSYSVEVISKSMTYCNILKVNDEEVDVIGPMLFEKQLGFEEFCDAVVKNYPQIVTIIITAGKDGCWILDQGQLVNVPTEPITVRDTVGAGDSFSAAFTSMYAKTQDPIKSAKVANKVGGFVASSHGSIPEYSSEIVELINS